MRDEDRVDLDSRFVDIEVDFLIQKLFLGLGHIFSAHIEHVLLADVLARPLLLLSLVLEAQKFLLRQNFPDVLIGA